MKSIKININYLPTNSSSFVQSSFGCIQQLGIRPVRFTAEPPHRGIPPEWRRDGHHLEAPHPPVSTHTCIHTPMSLSPQTLATSSLLVGVLPKSHNLIVTLFSSLTLRAIFNFRSRPSHCPLRGPSSGTPRPRSRRLRDVKDR